MPSPARGSSILTTSAPRSDSTSVAYAPGSRRVRSRTRTPSSALTAQSAVAEAVREVQDEADHEPAAEAFPCGGRQPLHDEDACCGAADTDGPRERHAERTRTLRLGIAQHQHADTDEHEREQRTDVRQI